MVVLSVDDAIDSLTGMRLLGVSRHYCELHCLQKKLRAHARTKRLYLLADRLSLTSDGEEDVAEREK
jgi:hypothetical protein